MVNWYIIIVLSIICGIAYRLGGIGKPFNTLYRDLGCSLISTLSLTVAGGGLWWGLILHCGLIYAALTTYNKWASGGGSDVKWPSWAVTGLFYGLAAIPLAWVFSWYCVLIRSAVLAVTVAVWSTLIGWDDLEEFGRGFLITATVPILLI